MSKKIKLTVGMCSLLTVVGCATMEDGFYDKVAIDSNAKNAYCTVAQDGAGLVDAVVTPGDLLVRRKREAKLTVTCRRDGYKETQMVLEPVLPPSTDVTNTGRSISGFLLSAGIGVIVDSASGANYSYDDAYVWMAKE